MPAQLVQLQPVHTSAAWGKCIVCNIGGVPSMTLYSKVEHRYFIEGSRRKTAFRIFKESRQENEEDYAKMCSRIHAFFVGCDSGNDKKHAA